MDRVEGLGRLEELVWALYIGRFFGSEPSA